MCLIWWRNKARNKTQSWLSVSTRVFRLLLTELSRAQFRPNGIQNINSGSVKPPFVLPLELVSELYLEKNKHQKLTFLEAEEEPGKISHMCKEKYSKRSFFLCNDEPEC